MAGPDDPILMVTTKGDASLVAIDVASGELVGKAGAGDRNLAKPHELTLTQDGKQAVVSLYGTGDYGDNQPANQLSVIDLSTMTEVRRVDLNLHTGPHGLTTDDDGKIWVTVENSQSALIIDPASWQIEQTVWLQVGPHFLARSHDGRRLYFSHKQYPFLTVVDIRERRVVGRIDMPRGAQAIRVSPDDRWLYAGDFNRPFLHRVDCAAMTLERTAPLEGVPGWPYPTPDGRFVLVTTFDEAKGVGYVEIFDAGALSALGSVQLPAEPFHSIAAGDGRRVYVALADGCIPVIDLEQRILSETRLRTTARMPEALALVQRRDVGSGRALPIA